MNEDNNLKKLDEKKKHKLEKYAKKYKTHETLLIATTTRKTIRYVERNIITNRYNFKLYLF